MNEPSTRFFLLNFVGLIAMSSALVILSAKLDWLEFATKLIEPYFSCDLNTFSKDECLTKGIDFYNNFNILVASIVCSILSGGWVKFLTKKAPKRFYVYSLALVLPVPVYLLIFPFGGLEQEYYYFFVWILSGLSGLLVGYFSFRKKNLTCQSSR